MVRTQKGRLFFLPTLTNRAALGLVHACLTAEAHPGLIASVKPLTLMKPITLEWISKAEDDGYGQM